MKRGDRVIVGQREDRHRGGSPVLHGGKRGTVQKLNGSGVLIELDNGNLAWVQRKWLKLDAEQPQAA